MTGPGHRRTAILKGYAPVRISTAREAYEHSERRFSRLQSFSFTSEDAPLMVSSGPRRAGWSMALVKSTGHRIALGDDDKVSLLFPYRGEIAVQRRGAESLARADELLIVAPGQRTTVLSSDYLGVLIQIPIDVFEASLAVRGARGGRMRRTLEQLDAGHPAALAAFDAVEVLEATQPSLHSPQAWRKLVDPILEAVADPGEASGAAALPRALEHVRAAEAFMAANLHRKLTVAEIAHVCGVGARALQVAFRHFRRRSPLEVLNDLRVREASRRLAAAGNAQSVTEVALDCGFTHLGRFSASYRAARGERPSTTARQRGAPVKTATRRAK